MIMNAKYQHKYIFLTCLVGLSLAGSVALASDTPCGKPLTVEQKAQRALDVNGVQNVMGLHELYGAPGPGYPRGRHDKEIELIWAHKTPGMTFSENSGTYKGDVNMIKKLYGDSAGGGSEGGAASTKTPYEEGGPIPAAASGTGSFNERTLETPIIEIAGDGQTAKGWWYTIGWSALVKDGKGYAKWGFERYGVDFVKEDGEWKIWHFHVYNDFDAPFEKNFAQNAIDIGTVPDRYVTARPGLEQYFTPTVYHKSFDPKVVSDPLDTPPPMPYCHISDTFSY